MKMKKGKMMKMKKSYVGRYCRVYFDDTGAQDGIVTSVQSKDDFRFLPLDNPSDGDQHNNCAPCIAIGNRISAIHSGLND